VHLYVLSPSCFVVRHRCAYTLAKSTFQEREGVKENKFLLSACCVFFITENSKSTIGETGMVKRGADKNSVIYH